MKIYIEDGQAIPAVKVLRDSEPSPPGFTEVVDIPGIAKFGEQVIDVRTPGWYDKKCVREKLKTAVYTKMQIATPADTENQANWDLLTAEEKSIAAHWFLVGRESFLLEVVNDLRYWTVEAMLYRDWTMVARLHRLEAMEAVVFLRIWDLGYAKDVLADLAQITKDTVIDIDDVTDKLKSKVRIKRMTRMYVDGLESEADDGIVAIKDYIDSTAETPFENNGFRGLDPIKFRAPHTPDTVADELLEIINNDW